MWSQIGYARAVSTRDYAKGLIAAPEDREPIVRKLVEGAGGRLVNFSSRLATPTSCLSRKLTRLSQLSLLCWQQQQRALFPT